jgi:hypothetical protein
MYYVQFKDKPRVWITDMEFASLDEALDYAKFEAEMFDAIDTRVIEKKNGKVTVLELLKATSVSPFSVSC